MSIVEGISIDRVLDSSRELPPARPRKRLLTPTALGALAVLLIAGALLAPSFTKPGNVYDEGIALSYPAQVLKGAVPDRNFETFYGPANPWLLAGAYSIGGTSLKTERAVGLAYELAIVISIFYLAVACGFPLAWTAGVAAAVVLVRGGLGAYAEIGGLAFALAGLAVAVKAARPSRRSSLLSLLGGVLSGLAVLFRFDFVLPVVLGSGSLAKLLSSRDRRRLALGFGLGVAGYIPFLALGGGHHIRKVIHDIVAAHAGRHLPLPAVSTAGGQLLVIAGIGFIAIAAGAVWAIRRAGDRREAYTCLAAALFAAGFLPYVWSRIDYEHLIAFAVVPVALCFPLTAVTARRVIGDRVPRIALIGLLGVLALLLAFAAPLVIKHPLKQQLDSLRGRDPSVVLTHQGRAFRFADPGTARHVSVILTTLDRLAKPNSTLYVGQRDLRLATYNDVFLYWLTPRLRPASFYMEVSPGTANGKHSGLASEIRQADFLILNSYWDDHWGPPEPAAARTYGSAVPNTVVAQQFCRRAKAGTFELLQRCRGPNREPKSQTHTRVRPSGIAQHHVS